MSKSKMIAATSILSVALMGAVLPATASLPTNTLSKNVAFQDLDLSNVNGQSTLYKRLQKAAKNVCATNGYRNTKSLVDLRDGKACYKTTLTAAVQEIDNAALTELHKL